MIVVRTTFNAKPGMAGTLAARAKEFGAAAKMKNLRVMTDVTGDFNQVILEHDVESLAELEEFLARAMSDPEVQELRKGYTELWMTGKRELFRVA